MTRFLMQIAGYTFLILGLLGLVLPVLQGVLFLIIGLILLGRSTKWANALLGWLKSRHPKLESVIGTAEGLAQNIESRFARFFGKV